MEIYKNERRERAKYSEDSVQGDAVLFLNQCIMLSTLRHYYRRCQKCHVSLSN